MRWTESIIAMRSEPIKNIFPCCHQLSALMYSISFYALKPCVRHTHTHLVIAIAILLSFIVCSFPFFCKFYQNILTVFSAAERVLWSQSGELVSGADRAHFIGLLSAKPSLITIWSFWTPLLLQLLSSKTAARYIAPSCTVWASEYWCVWIWNIIWKRGKTEFRHWGWKNTQIHENHLF